MDRRRLIDVIEPDDLKNLCTDKQNAIRTLMALIRRLTKPRAYVCEPARDDSGKFFPLIWDEGMEVLGNRLVEQGVSVVDAGTVRFLMSWPAHVARLSGVADEWMKTADEFATRAHEPNPFLWPLITSQTLQGVMLPNDPNMEKSNGRIREEATQHELHIYLWHPTWLPRSSGGGPRWGQPPPKKAKKPSRKE